MGNISINMEVVDINEGETYFVIDALYLNTIKPEIGQIAANRMEEDLRQKVFPYNDIPFAKFKALEDSFSVNQIRSIAYDKIEKGDLSVFSTDTGLILLIHEHILMDVVKECDYGTLVDSTTGPVNLDYWNRLAGQFNKGDMALILSPGLGFAVDFSGSGSYRIE